MSILPTQSQREVSVKTVLGADVLLFKRMHCSEALGRLSEFRIELASERGDIRIADVLGTGLTVSIDLAEGGQRHFHGIVTQFSYQGWRDDKPSYQAVVHPALWLLTRATNCRIFQDKSALEIVKAVVAEYGGLVSLKDGLLSSTPAPRTYCVQYRESDFNFVCRLLEEEGIYYYFAHRDGAHTLVLADGYGAHQTVAGYETILFRDEEEGRDPLKETVTRFAPGGEIQASVVTLNDFDFEKASASTSGALMVKATIPAPFDQRRYEHYDYPGRYVAAGTGNGFARARIEALHGQGERIEAAGNARGLTAGALFTLAEHPRSDQNRAFLITGTQTEVTGTNYRTDGSNEGMDFRCVFEAIGKEHAYRAPAGARKPVVQGPQTAMVVGKSGEEIWTDQYGRIKVQFHWDRDGASDETSSCWVRVQQGWAGKGWGMMFVPRVGMEVVVSFLEGDPDRPLVTGCVYNGDAMPPHALPAKQTRSTIKSNSSKGGANFNELRFDDKKGAEQFYMHAARDLEQRIKGDALAWVGGDHHTRVGKDSIEQVDGDRHYKIGGDRREETGGSATQEAALNMVVEGGMKSALYAGQTVHIKAGMNVVIEAGANITLKAGAAFLSVGPAVIVGSTMPLPMPSASTAVNAAVLAATIRPGPPPVAPREADDGKS
ncbi:type VI secretion system Vgr family protein [Massilia arenae]|uniref:type VI secretion system Vgr family protein n=1 Tax=Massilia arenae TaxID=2603288 RepID=UPI001C9C57F9|nr:type VI secretion system tip protein VgrG [Massilia arenae]